MSWYRLPRSGQPYFTAGRPPVGATPIAGPDSHRRPTVKEVLADVDDDPAAAQVALDAENAGDNPRSSLIEHLQRIIEGPDQT